MKLKNLTATPAEIPKKIAIITIIKASKTIPPITSKTSPIIIIENFK